MFNYLTIEQAIKYVSSKVEYEFLFDNLKDLEAFQIINPVFFFKGFAKFQCSDFSGNSEIGGYFCLSENESLISNKDILFEKCFLSEPALDYYDSFSDIEVCLDIEKEAKNSEKLFKWVRGTGSIEVNPYHYNFHLYNLDDDGNEIIKHEINLQDIRIKKYELDKWLSENSEQQRIAELENELAQVKAQLNEQQTPQRTRAQTDETNTDKKLIAMMALLLAKQSNVFCLNGKPNYKQINNAILNLATDLKIDNEDMTGLRANANKISQAVQAHADMFKLSKD
tara:strand:+ start:144 stop:989 length:846 start_codon:yes stop_codon:yes gene_type:complete